MDKNIGLGEVKERVKGLACDGKSRNVLIAASSGLDRQAARQAKQSVGRAARVVLLAYAMLRNIPYDRLERTTRTPSWQLGRILDEVSAVVSEYRPGAESQVLEWFQGQRVSS